MAVFSKFRLANIIAADVVANTVIAKPVRRADTILSTGFTVFTVGSVAHAIVIAAA